MEEPLNTNVNCTHIVPFSADQLFRRRIRLDLVPPTSPPCWMVLWPIFSAMSMCVYTRFRFMAPHFILQKLNNNNTNNNNSTNNNNNNTYNWTEFCNCVLQFFVLKTTFFWKEKKSQCWLQLVSFAVSLVLFRKKKIWLYISLPLVFN